jgi:hypothetical protein
MIRSSVDYGAHEQEENRNAGTPTLIEDKGWNPVSLYCYYYYAEGGDRDRASFFYDSTSGLKARGSKSVTRLRRAMLQARSIIITTVNRK